MDIRTGAIKRSFNRKTASQLGFLKENKWAIWVILASLLLISVVAYFVFRTPKSQPAPKVTLLIDAPQQTPSGNEIVYRVQFANDDSSAINSVHLDMIYPQGFTFTQSTPNPSKLDGTQFTLPNLSPGQSSMIIVKGNITGNSGEIKTVRAAMHYRFVNFNSDFVAQSQSQSQITNTNIVMQFDGVGSINNAQSSTYTLTYTNTTNNNLSGLNLKINVPPVFTVDSYEPLPFSQNVWNLPVLQANQSASIKITGRFSQAEAGGQQIFSAEMDGRDASGQIAVLSNATYAVNITAVPLSADLTITDQSDVSNSAVVSPGDFLTYKVHYKNNNNIAMTGINLNVVISGEALDLASIHAPNASVNNNVVSWNASQVSAFNSLSPNQEGDLSFQAAVKNPATLANVKNLSIVSHSEISSAEIQQPFLSSNVSLKVQTVPQIQTAISYSGGANPLRVGQPTAYLVTILLRNSSDDLSDTIVTMNLPNSLGFDKSSINSAEQQNTSYDPNTKKLSWNAGLLAAHTGDFVAIRKLQFTVTITPGPSNLGQPMTLVNNILLNGTDSFTASQITKTAESISTISDPSGQGIVTQ